MFGNAVFWRQFQYEDRMLKRDWIPRMSKTQRAPKNSMMLVRSLDTGDLSQIGYWRRAGVALGTSVRWRRGLLGDQ